VAKHPSVGALAPDFELDGTDGSFKLSAHRGRPVVLLFYPADRSAVCTLQFRSYRDHAAELAQLDATIVGISPQQLDSHVRFRDAHALTTPLLADLGGSVAASYGVNGPGNRTRRATFVIDREGIIRYRHDNPLDLTYDTAKRIAAAVAALYSV
jgi:peroxiredoxin Q/BCP